MPGLGWPVMVRGRVGVQGRVGGGITRRYGAGSGMASDGTGPGRGTGPGGGDNAAVRCRVGDGQ